MRAQFVNEIQRAAKKSGLGSIGVGDVALFRGFSMIKKSCSVGHMRLNGTYTFFSKDRNVGSNFEVIMNDCAGFFGVSVKNVGVKHAIPSDAWWNDMWSIVLKDSNVEYETTVMSKNGERLPDHSKLDNGDVRFDYSISKKYCIARIHFYRYVRPSSMFDGYWQQSRGSHYAFGIPSSEIENLEFGCMVTEIQRAAGKSGLASIGVGRDALQFINQLRKHPMVLANFKSLRPSPADSTFHKELNALVAELLGTDRNRVISFDYVMSEDLDALMEDIMQMKETKKLKKVIPFEEVKFHRSYNEMDRDYEVEYVHTGRVFQLPVEVQYNDVYGVAHAWYTVPEEDLEEGIEVVPTTTTYVRVKQ